MKDKSVLKYERDIIFDTSVEPIPFCAAGDDFEAYGFELELKPGKKLDELAEEAFEGFPEKYYSFYQYRLHYDEEDGVGIFFLPDGEEENGMYCFYSFLTYEEMDKNVKMTYGKSIAELLNWARKELDEEEKDPMTKEELTKIRESLALTKKELAEKLGVTAMLLGRYESGSCKISDAVAERVLALISPSTEGVSSDGENQDVMGEAKSESIEEKVFSVPSNDEREEEPTPFEEEPTPIDDPISLIKSLRNNFTLTALGDLLGVSRTTVSNYENRKRVPGEDVLEKIKELVEKTVTPDDVEIEVAPADEKIEATSVAADEKIEAVSTDEKIEDAPEVAADEKTEEAVDEAEAAPPSISDLISLLRKTYTLSALGKLLGVSGTAVSNYESGKNTPKEKIIKKIEELVEKTKATTSVEEEEAAPVGEKEVAPVDEKEAAPADEKEAAPADEEVAPADEEKTAPNKVEIYIQSLMGGSITTEDILSRLPDGVETVYIKPEENAAYWVRGAESGSINLW